MKEGTFQFSDYASMVIYLVVVLIIGFWFSKKENSSEEYLLGGRKIPWMAVGISYMMSLLSTYSLVMIPGEIFNHGVTLFILSPLAPLLNILFFCIFMKFYFKMEAFTPFEYLEKRYDKKVRLLVSMIYLWSRLLYLAMVLYTSSKVFEGGVGWPASFTILLVGTIGIAYTVMGGMKAVIWTDVMQFFVLVGGLGVAVGVLILSCDGGFTGIISYALDHGRGPVQFAQKSFYTMDPYVRLCLWLLLLHTIIQPLFQSCADQISIQRLLSTSSYKNAKKAIITSSIITWPFQMVLWFIGFAIFAFYSQNPDPRVTSGDTAFFTFITTRLPSPVPGMIFAALLAAVMSTLDSGMNSLSAVWLKEIHVKYINPDISEKNQVKVSRWATVAIGIFCMLVGIGIASTSSTLKQSVSEAAVIFGALGVVIIPAYVFAVFSEKITSKIIWLTAALCWGMNFGTITWYTLSKKGYTGAVSEYFLLIPLAIVIVCFAFALLAGKINGTKLRNTIAGIGLFPSGYFLSMVLWYVISHTTDGGALSFKWVGFPGFIMFFLVGGISIIFSSKTLKSRGLTWRTINEEIIE